MRPEATAKTLQLEDYDKQKKERDKNFQFNLILIFIFNTNLTQSCKIAERYFCTLIPKKTFYNHDLLKLYSLQEKNLGYTFSSRIFLVAFMP
jgi:hypothetical protein